MTLKSSKPRIDVPVRTLINTVNRRERERARTCTVALFSLPVTLWKARAGASSAGVAVAADSGNETIVVLTEP